MSARSHSTRAQRGSRFGAADATLPARVFALLADGEFRSGEALAASLGVSRSAVWKAVEALRELGLEVHAVPNRGYRLARACEVLDATRIRAALPRETNARLERLDVAWSLESTNAELAVRAAPSPGTGEVLLAEYQTAGRGRRGRSWLAPPGGAICLSLGWSFELMPRDVGALSLAIGVCVLRALGRQGVEGISLKWPNDVLSGERKLGGILIELRAEASGPAYVIVGIGLNVALGRELIERIEAQGNAPADLRSIGAGHVSRNALAADLIAACTEGLLEFERHGLRPFVEEWRRADALRGRAVTVQVGESAIRGIARGIGLAGELMVETPHGVEKIVAGEVSVRRDA